MRQHREYYVHYDDVQIEDVDDERRNAEQVSLEMKENLVQPGCSSESSVRPGSSSQSSAFHTESAGFTSSSLPFASSSVSRCICGSVVFLQCFDAVGFKIQNGSAYLVPS